MITNRNRQNEDDKTKRDETGQDRRRQEKTTPDDICTRFVDLLDAQVSHNFFGASKDGCIFVGTLKALDILRK
jgi:hypothetical protein